MKKRLALTLAMGLLAVPLGAESDKKEAGRLQNCGTVIKEIMDIPDDIHRLCGDVRVVQCPLPQTVIPML